MGGEQVVAVGLRTALESLITALSISQRRAGLRFGASRGEGVCSAE